MGLLRRLRRARAHRLRVAEESGISSGLIPCDLKIAHESAEEAEQYGKKHGVKMYVYECPHCLYFHLTKQLQDR